jgi:hypothetical protein
MVVTRSPTAIELLATTNFGRRFVVKCTRIPAPPAPPPPMILIQANQAGQEGIATLPVLLISMQAM